MGAKWPGTGADLAELSNILQDTLDIDDFLDFERLNDAAPLPLFQPGALAKPALPPDPADDDTSRPLST